MTVSAVIVHYQTPSLIGPLLDNLFRNPEVTEAIVVDNGHELTKSSLDPFPRTRLISKRENKGFAVAVNQGIAAANGPWILLINPDVRLRKRCLRHLLHAAETHDTPIAGPRFYWDDHLRFRLPPATGLCLWWDAANRAMENRHGVDGEILSFYWILRHQRFWEERTPFFEPFLSGACLLIGKAWLEEMTEPPLDERFFLYYEDTDLCYRAMRGGRRPLCVPKAEAVHYFDQSPQEVGEKAARMGASRRLFLEKHYPGYGISMERGSPFPTEMEDLGEITAAPVFRWDRTGGRGKVHLEFGVSPLFVPFIQTETTGGGGFQLPQAVWDRLSPGQYFTRVRTERSGTHRIWKWKKGSPAAEST